MSITSMISHLTPLEIRIIRSILRFVFLLIVIIDYIYPKNKNTIVFGSDTGEFISGSPKALFEYIKNNHSDYSVYYYVPFMDNIDIYKRIKYIIAFTPIFLKAKFLVSSHPPSDFMPFMWSQRKVLINTWHGTAFKSTFFSDHSETESNLKWVQWLSKKISIFIVSSKLESALKAECFLIDPRKMQYLGHPRNDILLKKSKLKLLQNLLPWILSTDKIILYAPTYRQGTPTKIFPFNDLSASHLNKYLEENSLIILLRGHVYDFCFEKNPFSNRIVDFNHNVCPDINSILPEIDILITDYSSLYVDYLLLDKPCIFIPYDLDEFQEKKGLLFDDYDFWTPGPKVLVYSEFIKAIDEILSGNDLYKAQREIVSKQLNFYQTDHSCEKVFNLINNWK